MNHLSIRKKYFCSVTLVCLISLLIVSAISYNISYRLVMHSKMSEIRTEAKRYSVEIDSWLAVQTAALSNIKEDILINRPYYDDKHLKNMLEKKYEQAGGIVNDYYVGKPDKTLISGCGYIPDKDYDCRTRDWYVQAVESKGIVYTLPYVDTYTGKMVITISEPIIVDHKLKGVLAADITLDYLMQLVKSIKVADNGYAFLIDGQKNIMTYPEKSFRPTDTKSFRFDEILEGRLAPLAYEVNSEAYRILKIRDYDNIDKYFYAEKIKSTKWILVFAFPTSEITISLQNLLRGFIIALIISIMISLLVIYFFTNGLMKPITNLTGIVKQFGGKNMNARCRINTNDEIGELGRSFNNMADIIQDYSLNLEREVEERTRELSEKNVRIQDSIEYARMIQQTILPDHEMEEVLKDYFIIWHPRDIVGGDFYWMRKFDGGFLIVIGDCTGHGVPGALMTMAVNSMLDRIVDDICHDDPAFILGKLNEFLSNSLHNSGKSLRDGLDAGVICAFDNGTLLYSGARSSLFVLQNDEITEVKGINHTIGTALNKKSFKNQIIQYTPDMSFYLATDGVKDQIGGEKHLPFGKKGLFAVLKSIQQFSMEEQKNIIWTAYEDYKGNEPFRDDVTVLGFRL